MLFVNVENKHCLSFHLLFITMEPSIQRFQSILFFLPPISLLWQVAFAFSFNNNSHTAASFLKFIKECHTIAYLLESRQSITYEHNANESDESLIDMEMIRIHVAGRIWLAQRTCRMDIGELHITWLNWATWPQLSSLRGLTVGQIEVKRPR